LEIATALFGNIELERVAVPNQIGPLDCGLYALHYVFLIVSFRFEDIKNFRAGSNQLRHAYIQSVTGGKWVEVQQQEVHLIQQRIADRGHSADGGGRGTSGGGRATGGGAASLPGGQAIVGGALVEDLIAESWRELDDATRERQSMDLQGADEQIFFDPLEDESEVDSDGVNELRPFAQCDIDSLDEKVDVFKLHSIGRMNVICPHCQAVSWKEEKWTQCCHKGRVKLWDMETSAGIMELFESDTAEGKFFRDNIRAYNSSLSFSSFGGSYEINSNRGPPIFIMRGSLYHALGSYKSNNPEFLSIYFYDGDGVGVRLNSVGLDNGGIGRVVMTRLCEALRTFNSYAREFDMMKDRINEIGSVEAQLILNDITPAGEHRRRFNTPTVNEVAALFSVPEDDVGPRVQTQGLVVQKNQTYLIDGRKSLQFIPSWSPLYDPMAYVLFHHRGDSGWSNSLGWTCREHYASRFSYRSAEDPIFRGSLLFQQFCVDMWCKIEGQRYEQNWDIISEISIG
jgi:hypothetical protein